MKNAIKLYSLAAIAVSGACSPETGSPNDQLDDELEVDSAPQFLSGAARRPRAERIRDVAASRGLTNGVLLAGIAETETGLSHCWSEATFACQGPHSASCGGPVIAGSADGPCSAQQGGLGMFQFDGGTYAQTIARDGAEILNLDGNISHAVDFVVNLVRQEVSGVNTTDQALAWMNSISAMSGNARFNEWNMILSCRYNGRCNQEQANKYRDDTLDLRDEFGGGFWQVAYSEGGLIREPSGAIAVIAGGAVLDFASMAELSEAGYGSAPLTPVAAGVISSLPTVPRNGTLLRNNTNGAISVIAGGAALDFNTMTEISEQGYANATLVNLSNRQYQRQRAHSVPSSGTIIRDNTSGAMAVVAGGKGFAFGSWGQVVEAGYETRPHVNMPSRHLSRLANARLSDGALLRDNITGAMLVVAGNAGAGFATWQEVVDAGYVGGAITNVPGHYLPALRAAQPADRTLLRNHTTGAIVVVAGGARFGFATWQEVSDAGYSTYTNVPPSYFTGSAVPRDGTLLRASKTTTVWLVTAGRRTVIVPPTGAVIVDLPPAALATIPTA